MGASSRPVPPPVSRSFIRALAGLCMIGMVWSFLGARDKMVWTFEVLPFAVATAAALSRRTWLSGLAYVLIAGFFLIQCLGGRYSVVDVPFPQALMDLFGLNRNPSDRIGHVFQGAVSALLIREWLRRGVALPRGHTLFWMSTGCALAIAAAYEVLEMVIALRFFPGTPDQWLGMQGDPFDAQWDMTMALIGAMVAQLVLSRLHDRSLQPFLAEIDSPTPDGRATTGQVLRRS